MYVLTILAFNDGKDPEGHLPDAELPDNALFRKARPLPPTQAALKRCHSAVTNQPTRTPDSASVIAEGAAPSSLD